MSEKRLMCPTLLSFSKSKYTTELPNKETEILTNLNEMEETVKEKTNKHSVKKSVELSKNYSRPDNVSNMEDALVMGKSEFGQSKVAEKLVHEDNSSCILSLKLKKNTGKIPKLFNKKIDPTPTENRKTSFSLSARASILFSQYRRRFLWRIRECFRIITTAIWLVSHITATSVKSCRKKINTALKSTAVHFARVSKNVLSSIVELTPRKVVKYFMIYSCHILPDMRNRRLVLFFISSTPSRFTRRIVSLYLRKTPVWLISWHAYLSLKSKSPILKLTRCMNRSLELPRSVAETVLMFVTRIMKTVSRILTFSGDQEGQKMKRQLSSSLAPRKKSKQSSESYNGDKQ